MPITAERVKPYLREALDHIARHESRKRNEVLEEPLQELHAGWRRPRIEGRGSPVIELHCPA